MRVGFDVRYLSQDGFLKRGVGRYVLSLLRYMLELDESITFYLLIYPDTLRKLPIEIREHTRVRWIYASSSYAFSKRNFIHRYTTFPIQISRAAVEIWHFPFSETAPTWSTKPFVVTLHDLFPIVTRPRYSGMKQRLFRKLQFDVLSHAGQVITVSHHTRDMLLEQFSLEPAKVTTVHHGVDRRLFFPDDKESANRNGLDQIGVEGPFFLYVGGTDPRKKLDMLIKVFSDLKRQEKIPHTLLIAGALSSDSIPLLRLVAELRLQRDVLFLDYVSDEQLSLLYSATDALVFPSTAEGFGLPILEALACGAKVVAFANSALTEVAPTMTNLLPDGDFASFRSAMLECVSQRSGPNSANEEVLEQYSWTAAANRTIAIYRQLLHSRSDK